MLIFFVTTVAIVATLILTSVALSGIAHYLALYQDSEDVKKLKLITFISTIILIVCISLSCMLTIKKNGYNMDNTKVEVEHGIRR